MDRPLSRFETVLCRQEEDPHGRFQEKAAIDALNRVMELELAGVAGVVKYTHYALMVYGDNRIPIVSWLQGNADESLLHARRAGELVTLLGGHPSLKIGPLLEEYARDLIVQEERHLDEVNKMLRKPGDIHAFLA